MNHSPPPGRLIRQALLYGAAFGLLVGLGFVAISGAEGREAIVQWRNAILAGAVLGFCAGLILALRRHRG